MPKYRVCTTIINQKWAPVSTLMTLGFHKGKHFLHWASEGLISQEFYYQ